MWNTYALQGIDVAVQAPGVAPINGCNTTEIARRIVRKWGTHPNRRALACRELVLQDGRWLFLGWVDDTPHTYEVDISPWGTTRLSIAFSRLS